MLKILEKKSYLEPPLSNVVIRLAEDANDFKAARSLCQEWLDWHWRHYPNDWPTGPDHPMDPSQFEAIMQNLPSLHEPPGGILIGLVDGQAVGCVMYHEAEPGVAEFNRLYVNEKGRGRRLGLRMLEAMFARLSINGFYKVFFTSATFLTHARAMYETAGFMDIPHPLEFPAEWLDKTYFMERHIK